MVKVEKKKKGMKTLVFKGGNWEDHQNIHCTHVLFLSVLIGVPSIRCIWFSSLGLVSGLHISLYLLDDTSGMCHLRKKNGSGADCSKGRRRRDGKGSMRWGKWRKWNQSKAKEIKTLAVGGSTWEPLLKFLLWAIMVNWLALRGQFLYIPFKSSSKPRNLVGRIKAKGHEGELKIFRGHESHRPNLGKQSNHE